MTKVQLKRFVPSPLLTAIHKSQIRIIRRHFRSMDRKQAFSSIYKRAYWGKHSGSPYCSGTGSADRFADSYYDMLERYISAEGIASVVDLGCGDFRIGQRVSALPVRYCGVDIVSELVSYNSHRYGTERVAFQCLDIVQDPLPGGELCLLRQVLQHLSNSEIESVLKKLANYPHVIITEHVPVGEIRRPNSDKPHGPDTRILDSSGVYVRAPPFQCKVAAAWEYPYDKRTKLVTSLLRNT